MKTLIAIALILACLGSSIGLGVALKQLKG
jgi:SNF family Na+-dependent transporter